MTPNRTDRDKHTTFYTHFTGSRRIFLVLRGDTGRHRVRSIDAVLQMHGILHEVLWEEGEPEPKERMNVQNE